MTDRLTVDQITSDDLDQLYDQLDAARRMLNPDDLRLVDEMTTTVEQWMTRADRAEAEVRRLRAGEEDGHDPRCFPTPGQWIKRFNDASPAERMDAAGWAIGDAQRASGCFYSNHEGRLAEAAHAWVSVARVRDVIADMENITGARHWARILRTAVDGEPAMAGPLRTTADNPVTSEDAAAEAVRQMDADPAQPHAGLVVQPYDDHGAGRWVFRCWGTDTCDGWLSLDHYSQQSAERARDRHIAEEHTPTEETLMPTSPCTATIGGPHVPGDEPVQCTREAGHRGNHGGPKQGDDGKVLWDDHNAGATPHRSEEQPGG